MKSAFKVIIVAAIYLLAVNAITIEDVYKRLLEKERYVDNTFSSQFIRPIGSVDGELIWPRSYAKPTYLFFDENGAAYNVNPSRTTLRDILERTPSTGSLGTNNELSS